MKPTVRRAGCSFSNGGSAIMPASRMKKVRKRGVEYSAQEITDAVWKMYQERGEPVTCQRFLKWSAIPQCQVYHHFLRWSDVRAAAGLPPSAPNIRFVPVETLLSELDTIVRRLGRWPTVAEYVRFSRRSREQVYCKIGTWPMVQAQYRQWVKSRPTEIPSQPAETAAKPETFDWWNSQQVMQSLTQIQWMRDAWLRSRVGFELKSSDFRGRSPGDCDFLVVLDHDWPLCPVPVIEFSSVLRHLRPA
jgi:hypothetical protein